MPEIKFINPVCEDEGERGERGHRGRRGPRGQTGPQGADGSLFQYATFPIVTASGTLDAAFTADVVPETPLLVFPAGWIVRVRATVPLQAVSAVDPTPNPPGGEIYGGVTVVKVIQDLSGAFVQRASTITGLAFSPTSSDGDAVSWIAASSIVAVSEFVSDGAAHTYTVTVQSPRFVGAAQVVYGNPPVLDTRLGLEIFASPP